MHLWVKSVISIKFVLAWCIGIQPYEHGSNREVASSMYVDRHSADYVGGCVGWFDRSDSKKY